MKRLFAVLCLLACCLPAMAATTILNSVYVRETGRFMLPTNASFGSLSVTGTMAGGIIRGTNIQDPSNVKYWGAVGDGVADDTAEIQAAIDSVGRIYLPSGTYKISSTLLFSTAGLGDVNGLCIKGDGSFRSIIDNRTGTNAIYITAGTDLGFQYNMVLQDFGITNATLQAGTVGILIQGVFQGQIDGVRIVKQASHGLKFHSTTLDRTDSSSIMVRSCDFSLNGGWGVIVSAETNVSNVNIVLDQCRIISNTNGGVSFGSLIQGVIQNSVIAYNLTVGVYVGKAAGGVSSKLVSVINNEFDCNEGTQLSLDFVSGARANLNNFICQTAAGIPVVTNLVKVSTNASQIILEQNAPRLESGYAGVTAFWVETGATYVNLLNTEWSGWQSAGNTKYANAGTGTIIIDNGLIGIGTTGIAATRLEASAPTFAAIRASATDGSAYYAELYGFYNSADTGGVRAFGGNLIRYNSDGSGTVLVGLGDAVAITSGKVGIGSNAPAAMLHVTGDNTGPLVFQAGTTNLSSLLTLNTNGLLTVQGGINSRTNIGSLDVTTNIFVLATRYTNSNRRLFVSASIALTAAAAGTATVALYVENLGTATNSMAVSAGPLASLVTTEPLFLPVGPGMIYYFADETSGVGASAAILGNRCSRIEW